MTDNRYAALLKKYSLVISANKAQLSSQQYKARQDAEPVALALPLSWRHSDRNVEFNLHSWRFLNALWHELLTTDNGALFDTITDYMADWWLHANHSSASYFCWYDMATGLRAIHLALALEYIALQPDKTAPQVAAALALLQSVAQQHCEKLHNADFIGEGNHGVYQIIGLRLLAMVTGYQCDAFCLQQLEHLFAAAFDNNHICVENSPFYHHYNIGLFSHIQSEWFAHLSQRISQALAAARLHTPWFNAPDGEFFQIGDTEGKEGKTAPVLKHADICLADYALRDFASSGYQLVHGQGARQGFALAFYAPNLSPTHAHADHLGVILYHNGIELLADSGKYTYDNTPWREYFVSDAAHNTVGLAAKRFMPEDTAIGQAALFAARRQGDSLLLGGVVNKGGFYHRRIIRLSAQTLLFEDNIEHSAEDLTELRFHFAAGITLVAQTDTCYGIYRAGDKLAQISFDSAVSHGVQRGVQHPVIQGWRSRQYHQKYPADTLLLHYDKAKQVLNSRIQLL